MYGYFPEEPLRITFRIIFSILVVISIGVLLFTLLQVRQERARLVLDLERRASLLGESFKETIEPLVERGNFIASENCGKIRPPGTVCRFGDL